MKTRQEMIYDFMLALCADLEFIRNSTDDAVQGVELIYTYATMLSDKYLNGVA